ncbi:MAG: cell division protein FtsQ/DivIB [Elusimicrobium sp.]|jgi:hypothetical protein|nr:cell division protein FtsQ/DivIB [Elusimicrobium sp.]
MKKLVYYNKPAGPERQRKPTNKTPGLLRPLLILALFAGMLFSIGFAAYKGAPKAAEAFSSWRRDGFNSWQFKTVEVKGLAGKDLAALAAAVPFEPGQKITLAAAAELQKNLEKKFPHLKNITVKRGLFTGKLRISAAPRVPAAELVTVNAQKMMVDDGGVVYPAATDIPQGVYPLVMISGQVTNTPEKVSKEIVQLISALNAFKKDIDFSSVNINQDGTETRVILKDATVVNFGGPEDLAEKAKLAPKMLEYARTRGLKPHEIDLSFYSYNKVYLKPEN